MPGWRAPADDTDYARMRMETSALVNLDAAFPAWPFRRSGFARIYEWDLVHSGHFGTVLGELAGRYGDQHVTVVATDPDVDCFRSYGILGAFRSPADSVRASYGDALYWEPAGDPTGALVESADALAIAGSSGRWAAYAERDWEVGLLLTPDEYGPWLDCEVPWFPIDLDIDEIRGPEGWCMEITAADRELFYASLWEHGTGA